MAQRCKSARVKRAMLAMASLITEHGKRGNECPGAVGA